MTDLAIADAPVKRKRRPRNPPKQRFLTLDALDERTSAYTATVKLIDTLATDMGGHDQMSEGERQLVTRAALLGAIVADFETKWVAGQQIPLSEYLSAVNVQRRVLATLGLERRQKDVTGFGAARMIEHEEMMREAAAKREQRAGDVFVPAAAEVEHPDDPIAEHQDDPLGIRGSTVALQRSETGAPAPAPEQLMPERAPVPGTKYEAVVAFTGRSPVSRVGLAIRHRADGEYVDDVGKENITLAEAAALAVAYGVTEIREDTEDQRALARAIREERHRVLKEAEQ